MKMSSFPGVEYFSRLFDKQYKYYYQTLGRAEQEVYRAMALGFLSGKDEIPVKGAEASSMSHIFASISFDLPCLFYVDSFSYRYRKGELSGIVIPKYRFGMARVNTEMEKLIRKTGEILSGCEGKSELEKERLIHDWLCRNTSYDTAYMASSYTCVGPLLFGRGVCEGISKAAKLLMDAAGIDSLLVTGDSRVQSSISDHAGQSGIGEGHAWNIVWINQQAFHLDVTFDITIMSGNILRYDYFNLSDKEILRDHSLDEAPVPTCPVSGSCYKKHGLYMEKHEQFEEYLKRCIRSGMKDIVFQMPTKVNFEKAYQRMCDLTAQICSQMRFGRRYQVSYNKTQRVFHIHVD